MCKIVEHVYPCHTLNDASSEPNKSKVSDTIVQSNPSKKIDSIDHVTVVSTPQRLSSVLSDRNYDMTIPYAKKSKVLSTANDQHAKDVKLHNVHSNQTSTLMKAESLKYEPKTHFLPENTHNHPFVIISGSKGTQRIMQEVERTRRMYAKMTKPWLIIAAIGTPLSVALFASAFGTDTLKKVLENVQPSSKPSTQKFESSGSIVNCDSQEQVGETKSLETPFATNISKKQAIIQEKVQHEKDKDNENMVTSKDESMHRPAKILSESQVVYPKEKPPENVAIGFFDQENGLTQLLGSISSWWENTFKTQASNDDSESKVSPVHKEWESRVKVAIKFVQSNSCTNYDIVNHLEIEIPGIQREIREFRVKHLTRTLRQCSDESESRIPTGDPMNEKDWKELLEIIREIPEDCLGWCVYQMTRPATDPREIVMVVGRLIHNIE